MARWQTSLILIQPGGKFENFDMDRWQISLNGDIARWHKRKMVKQPGGKLENRVLMVIWPGGRYQKD